MEAACCFAIFRIFQEHETKFEIQFMSLLEYMLNPASPLPGIGPPATLFYAMRPSHFDESKLFICVGILWNSRAQI